MSAFKSDDETLKSLFFFSFFWEQQCSRKGIAQTLFFNRKKSASIAIFLRMKTARSSIVSTRHLRGTAVHVFKEGRLFYKPSFLRPKRPCIVNLRGLRLHLTTFSPRRTCTHMLSNAKLHENSAVMKLVIVIPDHGCVTLFAENHSEYEAWNEAFSDALNWTFHRFYDLFEQLGRGAFAVVRRGRHRSTGDIAAVKIIPKTKCTEDDLRYLQREIDISFLLKHPNVVGMSDLFQSESNVYLVFEYLSEGTLQTFVERNGPVGEDVARSIMTDILSAVHYIHGKGVVHRDLKVCVSRLLNPTQYYIFNGLS